MSGPAYHGGAFFEAIGADLRHLERAGDVISADVLDAWFDPSPRVIEMLTRHLPFLLRTSPPNHAEGLIEEIAFRRGLDRGSILPGAGSSSLLFHCLPHLLPAHPRVLMPSPMYGEYAHLVERVLGGQAVRFALRPEEDFRLDPVRIERAAAGQPLDAIAIVNPNNPTGRLCPHAGLEEFLSRTPETTLVLVDETYIEYAGADQSLERFAARSRNVVVLKSMSKAYALSGERVAYLVAHPEICDRLRLYLPPWPVGLAAQAAAMEALRDPDYYEARYDATRRLRAALATGLKQIAGMDVFPSEANFLLVRCDHAAELAQWLRGRRIFVREFPRDEGALPPDFLRIAVKDEEANLRMLEAIGGFPR